MSVLPPVTSGLWGFWDATQLTGYANGAAVTTLPDLSGNGHDFIVPAANTAPTYNSSLLMLNMGVAATTGMSVAASGFSGNFSASLGIGGSTGNFGSETYGGFFTAGPASGSDYNTAGGICLTVPQTTYPITWTWTDGSGAHGLTNATQDIYVPTATGFSAAAGVGYYWFGTCKSEYTPAPAANFAPSVLGIGQRSVNGAITANQTAVFTLGALAIYSTTLTDAQMAQLQNFTASRIGATTVPSGGSSGYPRIVVPRRRY